MKCNKIDTQNLLFIMGITPLLVGLAIYLTFYTQKFEFGIIKLTLTSTLLQNIAFSLPSFLHVIAFTFLVLATYHTISLKNVIHWSIFWGILNSIFEYLQSYEDLSEETYIPAFLTNYFESGTFDWLDILSIWLGVIFSVVAVAWMRTCK